MRADGSLGAFALWGESSLAPGAGGRFRVAERERRVAEARLPGETDQWSVYRITFDDGYYYYAHTSNVIAWKVGQLCDTAHRSAVPSLVLHDREMGKTVECLASCIDSGGGALAVRNRFIEEAQDEYEGTAGELCQIETALSGQGPVARYYARREARAGNRSLEALMSTMPTGDDGSFGPKDFAGWPGTPSTQRLETAVRYSRISNPGTLLLESQRDATLRSIVRDIEMVLATMRNCDLVGRMPYDRLEHIARAGGIVAVVETCSASRSPTPTFAAASSSTTLRTPTRRPGTCLPYPGTRTGWACPRYFRT